MSEKCPDHKVLEEGDYSPVELAWCAYMGMEDYRAALEKHTSLRPEIEAKTHFEDDHAVVCYTKIRTDDRNFYQAMEKYEIYNNRVSLERFKDIVLKRYGRWDGAPLITECALFQNIVEDMILFRDMPDEAIIDFYRDIKNAIGDKQIHCSATISTTVPMQSDADSKAKTAWSGTGFTDRILSLGYVKNCFRTGVRCCPRNRTGRMILISYEKRDVYCQSRSRSDRKDRGYVCQSI